MNSKKTDELKKVLGCTHINNIAEYINENKEDMLSEDRPFADYIRQVIKEKGIKQQDVFLMADIPERYGYKIISEQKHTQQRDIILRICYAAKMTLEETQKALRIYKMPELYVKVARDAVLIVCFNERPGSIIEVNSVLKENNMQPLRTSGVQD